MSDDRGTWYFTFGVGSRHAGRFYVVQDETYEGARGKMIDAFGWDWSFQYSEADWTFDSGDTHEDRYRLKEIR